MKIKSLIQFATLYLCLVFFIFVDLTIFWVIVALITAFALFVTLKFQLRKQIEEEMKVNKNGMFPL